eukprot:CAMPEP_0195022902 /NCGR_PEP_ID=MMETSP0326_2-20130528/41644_1 /TAXON_ID=2866 ORGANISM="Crypthecodinium cohnii, Strain Seligo" /NCGR_SAMPLE_ID=MMETSP0326_2 /ASSEMBLY_ACC=CAM_ASM_000348 /LENGTH=81 /DNA_ID=CAMNT_0040042947 /DNA_START=1 /DNA_END=243 /DNA_ORIENTATION=+
MRWKKKRSEGVPVAEQRRTSAGGLRNSLCPAEGAMPIGSIRCISSGDTMHSSAHTSLSRRQLPETSPSLLPTLLFQKALGQ